jgi:hypothetical protein
MGDRMTGGAADFTATVLNVPAGGDPFTLHLVRNGVAVAGVPVAAPGTTHGFVANEPGRYRLELRRGNFVWALTTPIWLEP